MFGRKSSSQSMVYSCCLGESGYSLAALKNNHELLFCQRRDFEDNAIDVITKSLSNDVEQLDILGKSIRIVLAPGQYQLILMDAPEVPEHEMAKALRWRLKGLSDYPLTDVAVDAFLVPSHGVGGQRKKVFVAVTPLSGLKTKLAMFETALLEVESVSIAELALCNAFHFVPNSDSAPVMLISQEGSFCQLQIVYQKQLYLVRTLPTMSGAFDPDSVAARNILLELQRSIDYCLSELKLPEPKELWFTASFYQTINLLEFLNQELGKETKILDLAEYLSMRRRLSLKEQNDAYTSMLGALTLKAAEE